MQTVKSIAIIALVMSISFARYAHAQTMAPRLIPKSATVSRSQRAVFASLRNYLTTPGPCTLQRADEKTGTLVARCQAPDTQTWNRWAYCKVGTMNLLDTLQSSSAIATIKVARSARNSSFVTVTADLNAVYAFSSQTNDVACISNGALENQLMTAAGASPAPEPTAAPLF
jgi:putative hemolysin